jgi:hypothetical protein
MEPNHLVEKPTWRERAGLTTCFLCGRLRLLHTRRQLDHCEGTPLNLELTPEGLAALREHYQTTLYDQTDDQAA